MLKGVQVSPETAVASCTTTEPTATLVNMVIGSDQGARWALITVIVCSVALSAVPGAAAAQLQYGYGGESYDSYGSRGGPGYVYDSGYQGSAYGPSYGGQDGYGYSGVGPKLCFQADSAPTVNNVTT